MEHLRSELPDLNYAAFAIGYIVCLLAPGPNMIVVASVAIAKGGRAVLPISCGVAIGSLALSFGLYAAASFLPDTRASVAVGKFAGALLFVFIGWRMIRSPRTGKSNSIQTAEFGLGLTTAAFNPITGAYFASQFLSGNRDMSFLQEVAIFLSIGVIAFARCILIGVVFGALKARIEMQACGRSVSILIGCLFIAIAMRDLVVTVSNASPISALVWPLASILR